MIVLCTDKDIDILIFIYQYRNLRLYKQIIKNIVSRMRDVYGSFKFNGDMGYSTFKVLKNSAEVLFFIIQVFPTKLDYLDNYNELLKEVNDEINSLVFDYLGKTFSSVDLIEVKNKLV